ncbi:MAG: FtsW/RodA/SpoVE family cell cycle protein [Phycisphaerales bacterium]
MIRPGQILACCVLALLTLGVIMVNSADMSVSSERAISFESIVLSRSSAYLALAMLALGVASFVPVRRFAGAFAPGSGGPSGSRRSGFDVFTMTGYGVGVAALMAVIATVYLPVIGKEMNGSHRWLEYPVPSIGKVSLQPSEIAKWGMIVLVAWYAVRLGRRTGGEAGRGAGLACFFTGLVPALMGVGAVAGFIVLEDLGTGVLIGAVAGIMLLAGGAKVWQMALLAPPAAGALVAAIMTSEYRMKRLTAFLDPYADAEKTGFHMIQSMTAVANGNLFGRGLGHGLQKFGYLPEDRTDFLFAVICEELGVAGAALVVFLYLTILWAGLAIIRREKEPMLRLVGLGVLSTIGLQAAINLAVVTGLGPTKGIALPLLSSGGTGWILTAASVGLLLAMDRAQAREERASAASADAGALGSQPA